MKRFVILLVLLFWFCYLINGGFEGYVVSFFAAVIFSLILPSWDDNCYVSEQDLKDFFGEAPAEEPSHAEQPAEKETASRIASTPAVDLTEPCRYTWKSYLMLAIAFYVFGSLIYQLFF